MSRSTPQVEAADIDHMVDTALSRLTEVMEIVEKIPDCSDVRARLQELIEAVEQRRR